MEGEHESTTCGPLAVDGPNLSGSRGRLDSLTRANFERFDETTFDLEACIVVFLLPLAKLQASSLRVYAAKVL